MDSLVDAITHLPTDFARGWVEENPRRLIMRAGAIGIATTLITSAVEVGHIIAQNPRVGFLQTPEGEVVEFAGMGLLLHATSIASRGRRGRKAEEERQQELLSREIVDLEPDSYHIVNTDDGTDPSSGSLLPSQLSPPID